MIPIKKDGWGQPLQAFTFAFWLAPSTRNPCLQCDVVLTVSDVTVENVSQHEKWCIYSHGIAYRPTQKVAPCDFPVVL